MAINRTDKIVVKLLSFVGATLTSAKVQFAIDNWENEDFPRKLETQVRRWFADNCLPKFAALQEQYASLDEQSAKWLTDPCIAAQNAILKLKDEDDLALLCKRAATYTEISPRLWKELLNAQLSSASIRKLAARDDATRAFRSANGETPTSRRSKVEEDEAPVRRTRKIVEREKPTAGRRTGKAVSVSSVKPKRREVEDEYELDDDEPVAKKVTRPRTGNTVKKPVQKKVVSRSVEEPVDVRKVAKTVRTVRRPRV